MNTSLDRARLTIAVNNFEIPYSSYKTVSASLNSKLINGINNLNTPLYEVVSNNIKQNDSFLLVKGTSPAIGNEEDGHSYTSSNMPETKAKAVFNGKLLNYKVYNGKLTKSEKRG